MGIKLFSDDPSVKKYEPPNPDPKNFKILYSLEYRNLNKVIISVLEIHYTGCIPYQGNKILVYDKDVYTLNRLSELDPHFLENDTSPIARFPANEQGRKDALEFAILKTES